MKKVDRKVIHIILIIIVGCLAMAITDAIIKPVYAVKSAIKIIFFLLIPIIYFYNRKDISIKNIIIPSKKGFIKSLLLGIAIYIVIILAYLLLKNYYDFSKIAGMLTDSASVDGDNFIFVAIYISFCNSLLEELFFRGVAFLQLSKLVNKKVAYIFSIMAFSLYHVAIMTGWFSPLIFILAMLGLAIGGYIFNMLDEKSGNIYNSWMVHMFANFAINTVGFILFNTI